jgi:hypothetical protein
MAKGDIVRRCLAQSRLTPPDLAFASGACSNQRDLKGPS